MSGNPPLQLTNKIQKGVKPAVAVEVLMLLRFLFLILWLQPQVLDRCEIE